MDCVVIGAGLTGLTIARQLAEAGIKVNLIERRKEIGGNIFDEKMSNGQWVQKYGPHIFHTNSESVFNFINKYSDWIPFFLKCAAKFSQETFETPFDFRFIDKWYKSEEANNLKKLLEKTFPEGEASILELLAQSDKRIREFGLVLYKNDYLPYTSKQWGLKPAEIDKSVFERVKVKIGYSSGYFKDKYQLMPKVSFSSFAQEIAKHRNISVTTGLNAMERLEFLDNRLEFQKDTPHIFYTGPIDELFKFKYGPLPYRSLEFEFFYHPEDEFQDYPVIATPEHPTITRVTEFKKLYGQSCVGSWIANESSMTYMSNSSMERYYPVRTIESTALYDRYANELKHYKNLSVCGRLGDFKYYNMDQAILRALEISSSFLSDHNKA